VEKVRNWVKMNVSPAVSDRRTGTMAWLGSVTPGLSAAICGSLQSWTVPA
jgi:hypothetical protein